MLKINVLLLSPRGGGGGVCLSLVCLVCLGVCLSLGETNFTYWQTLTL